MRLKLIMPQACLWSGEFFGIGFTVIIPAVRLIWTAYSLDIFPSEYGSVQALFFPIFKLLQKLQETCTLFL